MLCCFMLLHQIVLRCLVLSSWCYAAWSSLHHALLHRMNFISKGFSTQNYPGSTSSSCLASAASLVAIFWFQLEKKRWRGEAPKIADSVTELMVKRQQLTFIKQKPTHFHIFLPPCQSVHKRSWNEETGTPSNLSLSSKRRRSTW